MITIALYQIIAMQIFLVITIPLFHMVSPVAAYLLVPVFIWQCLALYLNIYVVLYNEDPYFAILD
jgi:tryptophan-rich sensory protein